MTLPKRFIGDLLGWEAQEVPMGPEFTYVMFNLGNNMGAALSPVSEEDNIGPGDVILYFHSDDLEADMARVSELGRSSIVAAAGDPGIRRAGHIYGSDGEPRGLLAERRSRGRAKASRAHCASLEVLADMRFDHYC